MELLALSLSFALENIGFGQGNQDLDQDCNSLRILAQPL